MSGVGVVIVGKRCEANDRTIVTVRCSRKIIGRRGRSHSLLQEGRNGALDWIELERTDVTPLLSPRFRAPFLFGLSRVSHAWW